MSTSQTFASRTFLYPLIAIVTFGLIASACSSSSETSEDVTPESEAVSSPTQSTDIEATAEVTIEGEPLPEMSDESPDPAIGLDAPEVTGTGIDGEPVSITADGRAKAVYFLAHWCSHCQEEVPVLTELIATGQQPENLDIYAISTAADENQDNFPPTDWLVEADFPAPTILDNENSDVNRTYGQLDSEEIVNLWTQTAS